MLYMCCACIVHDDVDRLILKDLACHQIFVGLITSQFKYIPTQLQVCIWYAKCIENYHCQIFRISLYIFMEDVVFVMS